MPRKNPKELRGSVGAGLRPGEMRVITPSERELGTITSDGVMWSSSLRVGYGVADDEPRPIGVSGHTPNTTSSRARKARKAAAEAAARRNKGGKRK